MRERLGRFWQRVRLLVFDHLQTMFERAQEVVRPRQVDRRFIGNKTANTQRFDGVKRSAWPQSRIATAENELLCLCEELDLANTAAAQFDVMSRDRDGAVLSVRVNLTLDRVDVLDGRVIQTSPPDEWHDGTQKFRARCWIAGAGARLDHGRALPVLTHALIVGFGSIGRDRNLRRTRIGP